MRRICYGTIRSFLERDGIDIFHQNPNYKTSVFLYLFDDAGVEYDGRVRFVHPFGGLFRPMLPPSIADDAFCFRIVIRFLPDDTIRARVCSAVPDLFEGEVVFDRDAALSWEKTHHMYQDELQTDYTTIAKMPLTMIIEDDLQHFLGLVSSPEA